MVRPNHNVHVSINRRIEMPPAFHFPEDQIPPSDLVGLNNHDSPDNAQAVSGAYRLVVEFFDLSCHLSKQHECDFFLLQIVLYFSKFPPKQNSFSPNCISCPLFSLFVILLRKPREKEIPNSCTTYIVRKTSFFGIPYSTDFFAYIYGIFLRLISTS